MESEIKNDLKHLGPRCISVLLFSVLLCLGFVAFGSTVVGRWIYYLDIVFLSGVMLALGISMGYALYRRAKYHIDAGNPYFAGHDKLKTLALVGTVLQGTLLLFLLLVLISFSVHSDKPQSETTYLSITPNHVRKIYTAVLAGYCIVCFVVGLSGRKWFRGKTDTSWSDLDTSGFNFAWYNHFLYRITSDICIPRQNDYSALNPENLLNELQAANERILPK